MKGLMPPPLPQRPAWRTLLPYPSCQPQRGWTGLGERKERRRIALCLQELEAISQLTWYQRGKCHLVLPGGRRVHTSSPAAGQLQGGNWVKPRQKPSAGEAGIILPSADPPAHGSRGCKLSSPRSPCTLGGGGGAPSPLKGKGRVPVAHLALAVVFLLQVTSASGLGQGCDSACQF